MLATNRAKTLRTSGCIVAVALGLSLGCYQSSESFKPEHKATKAEIQQTIDQVNANKKMSAGTKSMVLGKLKKQLADAE